MYKMALTNGCSSNYIRSSQYLSKNSAVAEACFSSKISLCNTEIYDEANENKIGNMAGSFQGHQTPFINDAPNVVPNTASEH